MGFVHRTLENFTHSWSAQSGVKQLNTEVNFSEHTTMPLQRFSTALTLTAATVVALSGCVMAPVSRPVYTPQPQVVYQQQQGVPQQATTVYVEPPPPQYEVVGVAPAPGLFWIGGLWLWQGNRHVWQPGRWEQQRPGYVYAPQRWVRAGNGWQMHGGHWGR